MAQLEIKPLKQEEEPKLEIKPLQITPLKFEGTTEEPEFKRKFGSGPYGMPGLGDIWNTLANKSVLGIEDPGWATGSTTDPGWIAKKAAFEATTPLSVLLEGAGAVGAARLIRGQRKPLVPEVLPPEPTPAPRPIRGLLEAPKERFLAGPGGVQREALTINNAQEQARLLGYDIGAEGPLGKVSLDGPLGSVLDTGQAREAARQRGLQFTETEQLGGSRMNIPDRPIVDIPAQPFESGLGFNPISRSDDLEYPLNVVPRAVLPRSTQTVTRALAGDVPPQLGPREPVTFGNEVAPKISEEVPVANSGFNTGTEAIRPNEPILPSAPIRPLRSAARDIDAAAKNTGINPEVLNAAEQSAPPPVAAALNTVIKEESSRPSTWRSVYHQVNELSPELYRRSFRAVHGERQLKAKWMPGIESALRRLTPQERANFGAFVEGSQPITSPNVRQAVAAWKQVEDDIGNTAMQSGLRLFLDDGSFVPFQKNPNYWPHIPIEDLAKNKKTFIDKLVSSGMSRTEARRVEAHYRKTGEIKTSAQFARDVSRNFPYKLDADIALNHIRNMSKRIAQHTEFGPKDIKGSGAEGISDIIEGSKNPEKARVLMERIIGRDEREDAQLMRVLSAARKYSTITKLQNFTLPNVILGQATNALKSARHPITAMKEVSKLLSSRYRDEMRMSGVWQDFATTLNEEIKPGKDWFGIRAGESFNRGIAGAIGKAVAKESFRTLKANPADRIARKEIFELIGEDADTVLKQNELSVEQLRYAAGRMAEKTQGLNVPGNLAHWMSKPVKDLPSFVAQLSLIFKKMGYQQTRTVWDAIKTDPARAIPAWIAAAQVGGELVGDTKSGIRGLWTGDSGERIESRGSYWLEDAGITQSALTGVANAAGVEPEVIARLFDNYMQSFFLGLPADMLLASGRGPLGLFESAAGPVLGDVAKTANRVMDLNVKGAGKDVISALPVPGSRGLADVLMED